MTTEVKHFCDSCGKEIWWQARCATFNIYVAQGPRDEVFTEEEWEKKDNPYWKHREFFSYVLCEKCIGEKVTINHGDDARFSLSNHSKTFLRNFKLWK